MSPTNWDDKNDAHFLEQYRRKKEAQSVSALCFTRSSETYHHWSIFSGGSDGICISFDRMKLVRCFDGVAEFRHGAVSYKNFEEMRSGNYSVDDLPFIKRKGYSDENEYRFLHTSKNEKVDYPRFTISLDAITRITVSPWIHRDYFDGVKRVLKDTKLPSRIPIYPSTLIGNRTWQEFADKIQ